MTTLAENRPARMRYEILEAFEAGIMLSGQEVKSVKAGRANLSGAFVTFRADEAYLTNATIPPWQPKNAPDYDSTRPRKLLLHKKELSRLIGAKSQKGLTIVPLKMYTKGDLIKLEIALVKPLKKWDQRERIKKREVKREMARTLKQNL